MRRTIVLTQEELDDIDDNKWRRKSYALAQHNALPVPMPLPVYPPPKPCPPPPLVCRPSRPGVRPPRPGYRPPPGYRPSAGYRPSKTANSLPAMPEVLPTLSESGSATPELSPGMVNHTPDSSRTSSPLPPHVNPSPIGKAPSPAPPRTSTFRPVDSPPVLTSPACPTSQLTNSPTPQTNVLPTPKSPSSEPSRLKPLPTNPQSGQTNLPPAQAIAPLGHMNPPSRPTDPPPLPAHLQTNPPAADVNPNSVVIRPPPLPTKPPPSLKRPPSSQKPHSPPAQTKPLTPTAQHHPPAAQPNFKSSQVNPELSQAENPPPQTISPSVQTNTPSAEMLMEVCQGQTDPTSGHTNVLPVMADNPSPQKSSSPTEMTPPYTQTRHSPTPQRNPSPTESNPTSAQTDHPSAPENASTPEENQQSTQTNHPPTQTEPSQTQTNHSPEETNPPVTQMESFSPLTNHCPSQIRQSPSQAHHPPVRTNSPSTQSNPESAEITSPQINPQGAQPDPLPIQTDPLLIQTDPLVIQTDTAQTGLPETEITSLTSESPTPMTSSNLPPTPTSQHFPPTPTSLSRSTTPTSLGCPRTPTSIRAAPWQPFFPPTPLSRSTRTTPTPPCGTPGASPRSVLAHGQVYPPTPPSSSSHIGMDGVTPASSMSSLNHVAGQIKTILNEGGVQYTPDVGDISSKMSYPAILDVTSLHNDVKNSGTTENGETAMVEEDVNASGKISPSEEFYQTYWTRFWVLAVFSLIAFLQTIVWGTFGPITESALTAFPTWTASTIAAFPNWGPIIVVVFTIPMMWFTQKLGLRLGVVTCAILLTTGTLLRCFSSQELPFTIFCHIGAIFFAFAACMTLSLPAMVAAIWFPPSERITATAVGALMCQLGGAALYLEPLLVRYPNGSATEIQDIRGDIRNLMYIHFGAAAFLLVATVIYFPAQPKSPPSASSAKEKINFFLGIKSIIRNPQLLLVLATYSFSFGVPVVWIGVLNLSLIEIDVNQEQTMGVAVTAVVSSAVAAFIMARITDKVYGHLRVTIMALLMLSSVFFLWFLLLSTKYIHPTLAQVYVSVAGGVCFEYATVPLLLELAVETGYPIPESVTGAALTLLFNLVALVFLGLFQVFSDSHLWVSYVLFACVSLTILPLIFVKETHKRSDTDRRYIQRES